MFAKQPPWFFQLPVVAVLALSLTAYFPGVGLSLAVKLLPNPTGSSAGIDPGAVFAAMLYLLVLLGFGGLQYKFKWRVGLYVTGFFAVFGSLYVFILVSSLLWF